MNTITDVIHRYDDMMYESRPTSLNDFLSNKYNNVHIELYNDALDKYIMSIIDKYINNQFIFNFYRNISDVININEATNGNINFDIIYKGILNNLESNDVKSSLDILGIDFKLCMKILYDITINVLNDVKYKLTHYVEDENGNLISIIDGINDLSDIKDFRFIYNDDLYFIGLEESDNTNIYINTSKIIKDNNNNLIFDAEQYLIGSDSEIINESNELYNFNEFVLLYESENGVRIGYNSNGEWLLILDESTNFINNTSINNVKEHVEDYINTKTNYIHNLYKEAIIKLYKKYHKFIEIKNQEYWMPSSVYVIDKITPFNKQVINLSKYWNNIQDNTNTELDDLKITNENIADSELISFNYIKGIATLHSRSNDLTYEVPFKYLNENTNIGDELLLSNTFTSKYNELL